MSIWTSPPALEQLNALTRNNMAEHLGIRFTEVGDDFLRGTMPVDARTRQPYGVLHGGASVVLAETLGSVAGHCCLREGGKAVVGVEVNANHVRGVRAGHVTGTARPIHLGGTTQVWEIRVENDAQQLVCISRLTLSVLHTGPGLMARAPRKSALVIALCALVGACGQKGALYLPDERQPVEQRDRSDTPQREDSGG